ncbi:N-methylhydantoinase A/oxoprolinase/acetone carboxylase beta subunit [Scopulibacillus darangshiensis]|uniref:N-methylhydantoinase A/oxoprolinase/acetone carboxylase beta subunit n=1 Tax=Scopulibacillus darangshiensis TaxID=442528 RepID=A0A4R2P8X3_9BACL|nr:hydantoinase/oxoprolinase family protein [Scopulibacillus darangshiensis]TCP31342.1 N-methylhydantoinase A/oxoprolinase/acetone carboxylase beta subunit [Scopulibacillus darangshiensis]
MYRLGIDVGGTNTDAALLDDQLSVIHTVKVQTTKDVESGIFNAIKKVVEESKIDRRSIKYAMLGTTHCTNAIVERKRLNKVGVIRIGKPATTSIPLFTDWPEDLREKIEAASTIISGGYEFDGRLISELKKEEVLDFCRESKGNVESVAISGVFAPVNKEQEQIVAEWVKDELGDIPISLSHEIGSIGLLERENATILNAALMTTGQLIVNGFAKALRELDIEAELFFSQNDGTLMNDVYALRYPILTMGCGPTNSIRGSARLSGVQDAMVLDAGGTTTDIGVLSNGFPRQSSLSVNIGGVNTNFRMPDILSIGLGGGTCIRESNQLITVGPDSVGYEITQKAILFGGDELTASDVVTRLGQAFEGHEEQVAHLPIDFCQQVYEKMTEMLEDAIDQMKTSSKEVSLILSGGGSVIVADSLKGVSNVIRPDHYDAANAIGAALGQVSGEIERIYSLTKLSREDAIRDAKKLATEEAMKAGADESTVSIVSVEDIPLAYLPGNALFIRIKAVGDLVS